MVSLSSPSARKAVESLIERLLASPQYGVQWGRHWLDVVRYADTAGENTDRPLMHAWRYRNWVFDAFNRDLRYDDFVRQQLAGDLLFDKADAKQRSEGIVATGYLAIARRFGHDIEKDMHLTNEDVIDTLGRTSSASPLAAHAATTTNTTPSPPQTTTRSTASSAARVLRFLDVSQRASRATWCR